MRHPWLGGRDVHTQRGRLAMDADIARERASVMAERYQIALQRRMEADAVR